MSKLKEIEEKEVLYLKAKDMYYNDEPIMEDSAFDELEKWLKDNNSKIVKKVGSWDRKAKFNHPSKMGSLEKIQADKTTGEAPWDLFISWYNNIKNTIGKDYSDSIVIEWSQKLDGNAVNLIYENGILTKALSRGDGKLGRDYLPRIDKSQIPLHIPFYDNIVEVRCEAVVNRQIFSDKYARSPELSEEENEKRFSNERNYVAGLLNNDDATSEQISEIHLVPVEMHEVQSNGKLVYWDIKDIRNWGFTHYDELHIEYNSFAMTKERFIQYFNDYEYFKHNESPYRLDGMVAKINSVYRSNIGETEHHPKWAIAIKFKPENASTTVNGFEIKMGKTGNFTPVVLLEPIDLDGSIVSKASGYNYKYVMENNIGVGAIVTLVKSGDIIPQITSIDVPAIKPFDLPTICPHCGYTLEIVNDTHLHCPNNNCNGKKMFKFINSMNVLELDGVGDAFLEELYNKVQEPASFYITNRNDGGVKIDYLIDCGMKDGKILENFINELNKIKKLTIEQVIGFMSLDGMSIGGKTIKEIAKKISGIDYSFTGLEKKVVYGWDFNDEDHSKLIEFTFLVQDIVENGLPVEFIEKREGNIIKLCMTGSPKIFNFASKGEFVKYLESKDYVVDEVSVKDCDYLITDDVNSKSSKTTTAKKLNKQIVTYEYFN